MAYGYQMWCEAVGRLSQQQLVFLFLFFAVFDVPLCCFHGVINYVFAFIFAVVSARTRSVIKQSWSHSHSLNYIQYTHFSHFSKFQSYLHGGCSTL